MFHSVTSMKLRSFLPSFLPFYGVAWGETMRCLRIWPQAFLVPTLMRWLYCLSFSSVSRMHNSADFSQEYLQFLIPGIAAHILLTESLGNVLSSFFPTKFYGSMESILVTPISATSLILGYSFGGIFRSFGVLLLSLSGIALYTSLALPSLGTLCFLLLYGFSISFAGGVTGVLFSLLSKTFDHVSLWNALFQAFFYLSGCFFSVDQETLGDYLPHLLRFNPLFWVIQGLRTAWTGQAPWLAWQCSNPFVLCVLLWTYILFASFCAVRLLQKGKGNPFE